MRIASFAVALSGVVAAPVANTVAQCGAEEKQKLMASDPSAVDRFGRALALDGDWLAVGITHDDDQGHDTGSVALYERQDDGSWQDAGKVYASDPDPEDYFGWWIDVQYPWMVVGAWSDDEAGEDAGAAYLFAHSPFLGWTEQLKLKASDADPGDNFGASVAIDDLTVVVGAWQDDGAGLDAGAAYVFRNVHGYWQEEAKLTAADAAANANLGWAVAADRGRVLVGAWRDQVFSGSAYVFAFDAGSFTWSQEAKLKASDPDVYDYFGDAVDLSGDVALIGAKGDADSGRYTGSAYVFRRSDGEWREEAKLTAFDGAGNDRFGASLTLHEDAAVVGAWRDDDAGTDSGAAYFFRRESGEWRLADKLLAYDAAAGDYFGWSLDLDGGQLAIGAYGDDHAETSAGSAYAFEWTEAELELTPFEDGMEGAGGLTPSLDGSVCGWELALSIDDALGGTTGALWAGLGIRDDNPFYDGRFYIDFSQPFVAVPIRLQGTPGVPGAGTWTLAAGNLSAFAGLTLYLQAKLIDPAAKYGESLSNGLQVTIGQ